MVKNNLQNIIAARYSNSIAVAKRKNVTANLDEELLERLDNIVMAFNDKDNNTTRNAVIEEALVAYIEAAEDFFEKKDLLEDKEDEECNYDMAVFPAVNNTFNNIFIREHKWHYVRIGEKRVPNIKYIALYRGAPFSAITHYAEVISISKPNSENKREIELKEPIALENPVQLGDIHVNNVRKLFYTKKDKLTSAKSIGDLI